MYDIDAGDLIDFATRWASLGDAVTEQVANLVDNPEHEDINPAAIRMAAERLQDLNEGIDDAFATFFERLTRTETNHEMRPLQERN